ncbi:SDR family oxidoreductase [Aestuariibacter halophilus]|uniref:SDR family oxidoreductase n=1 Tax=Fluctibacter halophilus TaxID=226011 RepID=A0ABS8GG46_9ALTE|nr:SDR family oxidoreductase [Aestuariibacter halophilus]MCC2618151.1 SDR family oxidoreductase [Aestuariibacter halophilus]
MTQRVVITGGGSGLGRALALAYAARGAEVCISDRNEEAGQQVLQEIQASGGDGFFVPCDITDSEQVAALAVAVGEHWQGIDVLINNAGVATAGSLEYEDIEQWQWVLDVNVVGMVRVTRAMIGLLRVGATSDTTAQLINIASQAGITPIPMMGSYNAAKAAVVSFSETLHLELARDNISVTVACPSFFNTNLDQSLRSKQPGFDKVVKKLLTRGSMTAEQVATRIIRDADSHRFMSITHPEGRKVYWMKRLLPNRWYLAMVKHKTQKMGQPRDDKH